MLREVFYYNENFNLKGFKESSVTFRKMPKIIFGINLIKPYDDVHPPPPPWDQKSEQENGGYIGYRFPLSTI